MKKIKISLLCTAVLLTAILCTACGGSEQIPDELLKTAIQNEDSNYTAYNLQISEFSVNDRNYDSNYKTESVTVNVQAENSDTIYNAQYSIMGNRQDGEWNVADVQETNIEVLPQKPLPQAVVDSETAQLLQEKENVQNYLTKVEQCEYSSALEKNITVNVQLCSDIQYISTSRNYQLFYQYTLDGWKLSEKSENDIQIRATDDLCGTWVASDGEDSYKFVIDHIEGDTAYVKYQAKIRMPYFYESRMVSVGYDTLTPVQISVTYEDWGADWQGLNDYCRLKITFEKTKYSEYFTKESLKDPWWISIFVYPDHCPEQKCANGTIEDGKSYVLTDIGKAMNGTYILTKQ